MKIIPRARIGARLAISAALCCLAACSSTRGPMAPAQVTGMAGGLVSVSMGQLATCQSGSTQGETLTLDPAKPLKLIVHGCNASGGNYRALAEVFRRQGQQALCFNYDDRDTISRSANQLSETVRRLVGQAGIKDVTVIGHSQGGLVARRALVRGTELETALQATPASLSLVTVSAPFGGIRAASHCASKPLAILSLGLTIPICQLVTGSKWKEIPPGTRFITEPGQLLASVNAHLKIVTDEANTCRTRAADGSCRASDAVFSVGEQRQAIVDRAAALTEREIKAGHVEIVGDAQRVPYKLITILQRQGILASTMPEQRFLALLDEIYQQFP